MEHSVGATKRPRDDDDDEDEEGLIREEVEEGQLPEPEVSPAAAAEAAAAPPPPPQQEPPPPEPAAAAEAAAAAGEGAAAAVAVAGDGAAAAAAAATTASEDAATAALTASGACAGDAAAAAAPLAAVPPPPPPAPPPPPGADAITGAAGPLPSDEELKALFTQRLAAKARRDFDQSDAIRMQLEARGISVHDARAAGLVGTWQCLADGRRGNLNGPDFFTDPMATAAASMSGQVTPTLTRIPTLTLTLPFDPNPTPR